MASRKIHIDEVLRIAKAHHLEEATSSYEAFTRALQFWWCQKFNRPLKDPVLQSYTRDELFYEFARYYYQNPDKDPRKELEKKEVAVEDELWIRKMLAEEGLIASKKVEAKADEGRPEASAAPLSAPDFPDISTRFDKES